ncbi:MAG: methyl-accepting chemotaxis protein [Sulfuricellaceae bacterium]|nr:methyl-accepting chemotaxis protein [Sulfuricellaceae bacterium]
MKININTVRAQILVAIMGIVLLSLATMGIVMYVSEIKSRNAQIVEKSTISLQPIISLASRNIDGGNLMNLQNTAAQDLFKSNPDLLYLRMVGMSAGSPKTDYSEVIPSANVEYTYVNAAISQSKVNEFMLDLKSLGQEENRVNKQDMVLLFHRTLSIKNGGTIQAVFSAKKLDGVGMEVFKSLFIVFMIILSVSFVVAYLVGIRLTQPILAVVRQITDFTQSLDTSLRVKVNANNEIGELASGFNKHIENLATIVRDVHSMTDQVNGSANDIAAAVEEQAAITTQQSASMTEITATMEELSVSSSQIAENATSVALTSRNTLDESERGVAALNQLKSKMEKIISDNNHNIAEILDLDRKSKEIGKIMGIINEIADQTKMIAFNAAIEAASSGEAGKRFSVVAVEIRRLADNVTESTGEIESKIGEIQKSINRLVVASENGSKVINEGAQAAELTQGELKSIVEGAKAASESAIQISLSTQQQKTASSQVLSALTEIDLGLHQSSASIRQTSTLTHNLTDMSDVLKTKIEVFKMAKNSSENSVTTAA